MKQAVKKKYKFARAGGWLLPALAGLLTVTEVRAQQGTAPALTITDLLSPPALLPPAVLPPPDSLAAVPLLAPADSAYLTWASTAPELRELVADRIGCFDTDAPHAFNKSVMSYVNFFTERNRAYTQRVLERENLYFPLFEKYLAKYNLPTDLKYLAVVESALIPTAKSPVGATGLWQFMGPTAGDLRLQRDEWVDERMSPEKSTEAACKHLRYLYGVFHDWELVLAAYNWGAGHVQRVMKRTGKNNFWDLYPYMPAETRNYVPTFTAIMYAMKYADQHQLRTAELNYQYAEPLDTLHLRGRAFDLRRLSQAVGAPDSLALLRYNPEIRRAYLPDGYRAYVIQVPAALRNQLLLTDRETLLAYCRPPEELPPLLTPRFAYLPGFAPVSTVFVATTSTATDSARRLVAATRPHRKIHTVQRGQTVAELADWYGVTPAQLRRWNDLGKNQALRSRQKLVVFVPGQPTEEAAGRTAVAARPAAAPAPATPAAGLPTEVAGVVPRKLAAPAPLPPSPPAAIAAVSAAPIVASASRPAAPTRSAPATSTRKEIMAPLADVAVAVATPAPAPPAAPEVVVAAAADDTLAPVAYLVQRGDNLTKLARENGVTIAQLKAWNQLTTDQVTLGQKLTLRAPEEAVEPIVAAAPAPPARPTSAPAAPARRFLPKTYLVQPGDTLYNISRRYQGVTVEQLRRLNNLKSDAVKPGQKLIVTG